MTHYSRKDLETFRDYIDTLVYKVLGSENDKVISTIESCLKNGYECREIRDKLGRLVDPKKALKISEKLGKFLEDYEYNQNKGKKRSSDDADGRSDHSKKVKVDANGNGNGNDEASKPNLSSQQIKLMMVNAQREIEERKRALSNLKSKDPILASVPQIGLPVALASQVLAKNPEDEKARKIAELQAQIRAKIQGSLGSILPPVQAPDRPAPLILDDEGRTVDNSGRAINIPILTPTLKANIRAKKKETFVKTQGTEKKPEVEEEGVKFFDDRINVKPAIRNKRALRFHEPGKFLHMAERLRMKAQLEKLQNEISQIARKTGISSATKLALIAPKQDTSEDVPSMEWWDSVILTNDLSTCDDKGMISIRTSAITNLIEHPTQMKPPSEFDSNIYFLKLFTKYFYFIKKIHTKFVKFLKILTNIFSR